MLKISYDVKVLGFIPVTADQLKQCDVLISKSALLSVEWSAAYRDQFHRALQEKGAGEFRFREWKRYVLPDKTEAIIYLRIP